jgi:hypothetical protein
MSYHHQYILWICLFAYSIHILEEFVFNWRDWAESAIRLKGISWPIFCAMNAMVIVFGVSAAMVGWHKPAFALAFPALMLINGLFFHILPTIVQRRFAPGVMSGLILFIPLAAWAYMGASCDHVLNFRVFTVSFLIGALVMATPLVFLKIKKKFHLG